MQALLIRHAPHGQVDRVLCGRMPGIRLDEAGRAKASELADACRSRFDIAEIRTSPLDRARETAAILAQAYRITPVEDDRLTELDCGAWTGRRFDDLDEEPAWRFWNEHRSQARPPGGETMAEAARRMRAALESVCLEGDERVVAFVGHAEPIRAVLLEAGGSSFDRWASIDVPTASMHRLTVEAGQPPRLAGAEIAA